MRRSLPVAVLLLSLATAGLWARPSRAAVLAGFRDYNYGISSSPTISKPESKLWWNDGSWWGDMIHPASGDWHVYRLNWSSQVWEDTGTLIDSRTGARADVLWDEAAQKLYVASRISSGAARLHRFSYIASTQKYSLDGGFPLTINNVTSDTIVLEKDSTGQLWITYASGGMIWVNRSTTDDATWGTPFVLPVGGATNVVAGEDISSIVKFGGNRVGVFWGNQNDYRFYFAVHRDADPDTTWTLEIAQDVPRAADNHINLKSLLTDNAGRVFAAVKTSINNQGPGAPLIELLVREPTGGWNVHVFSTYADDHTVPVVLLDEENQVVYVFAVAPGGADGGGVVYMKSAPMSNIQFPAGLGTPFISSSTDPRIHNPTTTKQNLNGTTNLVVLASDKTTDFYLHNVIDLPGGGGPPPTNTPTTPPQPTNTPVPGPTNTPVPGGRIKDMTFESGSLTGADGADRRSGTVNVESAAPINGAFSARVPNTGSSYLQEDFTAADDLFVSFYIRLDALPGSNSRIALVQGSGTNGGAILVLPSGRLRLKFGSTAVGADSPALVPGTVYRVGIHERRGTGGNAVLEGYLASGSAAFGAPFASTSTGTWTFAATRLRVGATNANALNATFDDIRVDPTAMPPP